MTASLTGSGGEFGINLGEVAEQFLSRELAPACRGRLAVWRWGKRM